MLFQNNCDFNNFIGLCTLLYGETNTKKTYYTAIFVKFLLEEKKIPPKSITILDFAPKLNYIEGLKIGGKINKFYKASVKCNNITFKGDIIPPRLNSRNKKELHDNALKNYEKTSKILKKYNQNPTPILIINDISIYLHVGKVQHLLKIIKKASTFFGNTYYGTSINSNFTYEFSLKEKELVESLVEKIEYSYSTD